MFLLHRIGQIVVICFDAEPPTQALNNGRTSSSFHEWMRDYGHIYHRPCYTKWLKNELRCCESPTIIIHEHALYAPTTITTTTAPSKRPVYIALSSANCVISKFTHRPIGGVANLHNHIMSYVIHEIKFKWIRCKAYLTARTNKHTRTHTAVYSVNNSN